ncbi:MAG: hypothetical protein MJ238_01210 [Bacilli bacterium]|nr:hypothetical protein [Bacilli bacterium]
MKDLFISRKTMFVSLGLLLGGLLCCILTAFVSNLQDVLELRLILMSLLATIWIVDLGRKITHRHIRNYAYFVGILIVFWIVVRYSKYRATYGLDVLAKYCWYLFYVPIVLIPLFLFYSSLYFGKNDNIRVSKWWQLSGLGALMLIVLVLTNDLHHLVFVFTGGNPNANYRYNYIFYLIVVWNAFFLIGTLVNAFRHVTNSAYKKLWFIPFVFLSIGSLYLLYLSLGNTVSWFLTFSEMYWVMIITFFESLCAIKFIPTSVGYEDYFDKSSINTIILDRNNQPVFTSNQKEIPYDVIVSSLDKPVFIGEDIRINSHPIRGGHVVFSEDLTSLNKAKHRMEKYNSQLFEHNELLKSENELLAKEAGIKVNEEIYSKIFDFIRNEYDTVTTIIKDLTPDDPQFFSKIKTLNVYDSYIKRISNLILLEERNQYLSLMDLEYSLNETFEYLNIKGIASSFKISLPDAFIDSSTLVEFYHDIWTIVSQSLDALDSIFVTINVNGDEAGIRIMVENESSPYANPKYTRLEDGGIVYSYTAKGVVQHA